MGLFDKKPCVLCGKDTNLLTRKKLSDGFLCGDCKKKLSCFSDDWSSKSTEDVRKHLAAREENKKKYAEFHQSGSAGPNGQLLVDEAHKWFCFAIGDDYREGNPEVFGFNQLSGFTIEESYDLSSTNDSDSDGIPDNQDTFNNKTGMNQMGSVNPLMINSMIPPALQPYLHTSDSAMDMRGNPRNLSSLSADFTLNHQFIKEISFPIMSYTSSASAYELQKAFNDALAVVQMYERIRTIAGGGRPGVVAQQSVQPQYQQPVQQGYVQQQYQQPVQQGYAPQYQQPVQQGYAPQYQQPAQQGYAQQQYQQPVQQGYAQQQYQQPVQQAVAGAVAYRAFCPNCGAQNVTNGPFCPNCGTSLKQ